MRLAIICALVVAAGCTPELDEEPRCRLTADGWVCDEGATAPDAGLNSGSDSGTSSDLDSGLDPQPDSGEQDTGEPPPPPESCAQALARGDTGRGLRTLSWNGASREVFCDQTLAGGGWMLVGRSVAGAAGSFGWTTERGGLANDAEPYSFGDPGVVNELLIGERTDGKTWGERIYRVDVPDGYLAACAASSCATTVTTVSGPCSNTTMFTYAGFINRTDSFWFRDVADEVPYGLLPNGWSVFYDDCAGGELNGRQGMVFVR